MDKDSSLSDTWQRFRELGHEPDPYRSACKFCGMWIDSFRDYEIKMAPSCPRHRAVALFEKEKEKK